MALKNVGVAQQQAGRKPLKLRTLYSVSYWDRVAASLDCERLKPASFDRTLLGIERNWRGKKVLDYGCGPGVLASALALEGADVRAFDTSLAMRSLCGKKTGAEKVYADAKGIPKNYFDVVVCNLVLCIVGDDEAEGAIKKIHEALAVDGVAYIGFCNPLIFDVAESQLDFRKPARRAYSENHYYQKTKKEGGYKLVELHRPLEWYERLFRQAGFESVELFFTPEYELNGVKIRDFAIFKLAKSEFTRHFLEKEK